MKILSPLCCAVFASVLLPSLAVDAPVCKTFGEIYANGTQMVEKMWNKAFKVVPTGDPAYEQWWFSSVNPNNAMTEHIWGNNTVPTNCDLEYWHKAGNATPHDPTPESPAQSECLPWIKSSCCDENTVLDTQTIKEAYGKNWQWDRCGPISQGCERFFVQEACTYECDVNAGK
jgi:folate receptor